MRVLGVMVAAALLVVLLEVCHGALGWSAAVAAEVARVVAMAGLGAFAWWELAR